MTEHEVVRAKIPIALAPGPWLYWCTSAVAVLLALGYVAGLLGRLRRAEAHFNAEYPRCRGE
jgi:hypothetical protein